MRSTESEGNHLLDRLSISRIFHADHALLVKLEGYDREVFGPTGLRTYDLAVVTQAGAIYLGQIDREIVGSCQFLRMVDEPDFFYVVGFYIRPEWQGRGLGKAFLLGVAEEIKKLGAAGMVLTVDPENTPALNLYQHTGFADQTFIRDFYGEGHDRYIMRWRFG